MEDLPIVAATAPGNGPEKKPPEAVRVLGTISRLLQYPDNHYLELAELLYVLIQSELPEAARGVSEFGRFVEQCEEYEIEEAYTRTFDVNPSCALEVGWHLFGEDYMRGQFLVRIRGELAKYQIPESSELPDHLAHVLAVVAAMPEERAREFSHACVMPAIYKMQTALDRNGSPYRHLVGCLRLILEQYYGASEPWGENDEKMLRNSDAFPGQNGPRPPGMDDPLRSYPMPAPSSGSRVEFVPLKMQYEATDGEPAEAPGLRDGRMK